jgi:hypothetical protein
MPLFGNMERPDNKTIPRGHRFRKKELIKSARAVRAGPDIGGYFIF